MASWFSISERCEACGLRFERGHDEEHDYWLGAYTLNFIVTEVVFSVGLMPIAFYPFSNALWLAIDLVVRPAQPDDFAP